MEAKIKRTFVRHEAYLKLRNWIVEGVLKPGVKLKDKELAAQMGVSRTPIREALLRLEDEELVITKPNSTTIVSPIDFHNAFHLYSLVWSLERLALSQAFAMITKTHLEVMAAANLRMLQKLKSNDLAGALNADTEFHGVYIQLSQNRELERILSELKYKLKRLDLYYFEKAKTPHLSYSEHLKIIEAIDQKDLPLALEAVEQNWKAGLSRMNL